MQNVSLRMFVNRVTSPYLSLTGTVVRVRVSFSLVFDRFLPRRPFIVIGTVATRSSISTVGLSIGTVSIRVDVHYTGYSRSPTPINVLAGRNDLSRIKTCSYLDSILDVRVVDHTLSINFGRLDYPLTVANGLFNRHTRRLVMNLNGS